MRPLLRLLLSCLLLLALPLQGLAAGARLHCGSGHRPATTVAMQGHDHAAMHAAQHTGHAQHAGHDHPHDHDPAAADTSAGPDSCSACALCCHALALPALAWQLDGAAPPRTVAAAPPAPPPQFLTDGLERPPRPHLA